MTMSACRKVLTAVVTPVVAASCAVALAVPISASSAPPTHRAVASAAQRAAAPGHYTSRVVGGFGKAGTVHGSFVPLRSYVRNGKTVVQGNLVATLRRANGKVVGTARRHDVVIPVNARGARQPKAAQAQAAAATCNILHLVLGPLNLNLLGLTVHLNRVVLDITAVQGAGNLLGNLLCAVANLLNGPGSLLSSLQIGSLLSRIIGQLT
jgi:hypothetical protein